MDQIGVLSRKLRRTYLETEVQSGLTHPEGFTDRQSKYYEEGLFYLNRMIERKVLTMDLNDISNLASSDQLFNPINKITQACFFATARAKAIERSLYGTVTDDVVELAMLLSIFTNLLDEILDESPQVLTHGDMTFIKEVMTAQAWSETHRLPVIPIDPDRNSFATLLLEVMASIIRIVVSQPVWKSDPVLKSQFLNATAAAFAAEQESTKHLDLARIPSDIRQAEKELQLKSVNWAWAVSLAPACINGWPPDVSEDDFYLFTESLGTFGGWIDDLSDICLDYASNKWSNVFLEIHKLLSFLPSTTTDFPATLRNCLVDQGVVRHLTQIGINYHLDLLNKVGRISIDPEPIKRIISDTVLLYISHSHNSPAALVTSPDYG